MCSEISRAWVPRSPRQLPHHRAAQGPTPGARGPAATRVPSSASVLPTALVGLLQAPPGTWLPVPPPSPATFQPPGAWGTGRRAPAPYPASVRSQPGPSLSASPTVSAHSGDLPLPAGPFVCLTTRSLPSALGHRPVSFAGAQPAFRAPRPRMSLKSLSLPDLLFVTFTAHDPPGRLSPWKAGVCVSPFIAGSPAPTQSLALRGQHTDNSLLVGVGQEP